MYARVVRFTDVDADYLAGRLADAEAREGPPVDIPAKGVQILHDPDQRPAVAPRRSRHRTGRHPDAGSLAYRVRRETTATIIDLLRDRDSIARYGDIRAYTSQAGTRLEVVAADDDPSKGAERARPGRRGDWRQQRSRPLRRRPELAPPRPACEAGLEVRPERLQVFGRGLALRQQRGERQQPLALRPLLDLRCSTTRGARPTSCTPPRATRPRWCGPRPPTFASGQRPWARAPPRRSCRRRRSAEQLGADAQAEADRTLAEARAEAERELAATQRVRVEADDYAERTRAESDREISAYAEQRRAEAGRELEADVVRRRLDAERELDAYVERRRREADRLVEAARRERWRPDSEPPG